MSTDLTTFQDIPEELQQKILSASQHIEASCLATLNKLRLTSNKYIFPDGTEVPEFTGVIVGIKHANIHYPALYKKGVINPPDCFAVGDTACSDLTPHPKVEAKYCVKCHDCTKYQWKSALVGNGKACAEHTLLALYIPQLGEELFLLEEKKANSKACDSYLNTIKNKFGHPIFVYTNFKMGEKDDWVQTFYSVDKVPNELVTKLADRIDEAGAMLTDRTVSLYQKETSSETPVEQEAVREARKR